MMDQLYARRRSRTLVKPLQQHLKKLGVRFYLKTRVAEVKAGDEVLTASFRGRQGDRKR